MDFFRRFYSFKMAIPGIVGVMFLGNLLAIITGIFLDHHLNHLFGTERRLLRELYLLERTRSIISSGPIGTGEIEELRALVRGFDDGDLFKANGLVEIDQFLKKRASFLDKLQGLLTRLEATPSDEVERVQNGVSDFLRQIIPAFKGSLEGAIKRIESDIEGTRSYYRTLWAVLLTGGIFFIIFVVFFNQRYVIHPLSSVMRVLNDASKGVFRTVLTPRGPKEVKDIMTLYNVFSSMMMNIFTTLRSQEDMIDHVRDAISHSVKNIEDFNGKLGGVASGLSETSGDSSLSIEAVNKAMQDLSIAASEIAHNVQKAAQSANGAMELGTMASSAIERLNQSSERIGDVIKVISTIAEQTNLLALNATIEAARAGEAGKGFAVVANEVKELAKQTAQATEEITQMVKTIQGDTKGAVESVNQMTQSVEQVTDLANTIASATEEQTATLSEITGNVEQVSNLVGGLEKQATGLKEEMERLEDMNRDLVVCAKGMDMVKEEASNLNAQIMVDSGLTHKLMELIPEEQRVNTVLFQHLQWREKVVGAIISRVPPEVETDPTRCGLGRFLKSYSPTEHTIKQILDRLIPVHETMHRRVVEIQDMTVRGERRQTILNYFIEKVEPHFNEVILLLNKWSSFLRGQGSDLGLENPHDKVIITGKAVTPQQTSGSPRLKNDQVAQRSFIKWGPNFSVGIREIDEQHEKLVSMVNKLYAAYQMGKDRDVASMLLDELINYTIYHFNTEERYFDQFGYPEAESHKRIHEELAKKVLRFKDRLDRGETGVARELLNFLKDWLSNHICITDKRYSSFFHEKGLK